MPKPWRNIVTVSFMPRQEGLYEAALELKFHDHNRKVDFVIRRTLSGQAKRPTNGHGHHHNGIARALPPFPVNGWRGGQSSDSSDDEDDVEEGLSDNGIFVSGEDEGIIVGFVERKRPNGPFATATASLTIKLADGVPAVNFLEERIRTSDGSDSACVNDRFTTVFWCIYRCCSFVATFEGNSRTIQPGTESTVSVRFSPKFDGLFDAELKLVFYDVRLMSRFVVRRRLRGLAGSIEDHKPFESLEQENEKEGRKDYRYVPPQTVIPLVQPDGNRRSRRFPEYDVPPIVLEAVNESTAAHPYEKKARHLITSLRPKGLTEETYTQYFEALLNVEDGQQQCVP